MPKLAEVLNLPGFAEFTSLTAYNDLTADVSNITILEYEYFSDNFTVFHPQDLVLTSLFFAREDAALITASFARLIEQHVAAIAVKTVFYTELPAAALAVAQAAGVPVFVFHDAYMEDLIITFNRLTDSEQRYRHYEELVGRLLREGTGADEVAAIARELLPAGLPYTIAYYCTLVGGDAGDTWQLLRQVLAQPGTARRLFYVSILRYEGGLVVLATFKGPPSIPPEQNLARILGAYGLKAAQFTVGSSTLCPTLTALGRAIAEARDACRVAQLADAAHRAYGASGIYRLLLPLGRTPAACRYAREVVGVLGRYDEQYGAALLDTARAYTREHCSVARTASALYQHPNTIRYRLAKIRSLLTPILGEDDFDEQLYLLLAVERLQTASD